MIVVEGRADVVNLLRNGVNNVIGMNGTKLPDEIKELSKDKEITLFVDGDRGGKLIAQNVVENANVTYIATAPDGKEVEELAGKEILMNLRKKVLVKDFFSSFSERKREYSKSYSQEKYSEEQKEKPIEKEFELTAEDKEKLKKISKEIEGSGKAVLLDSRLNEMKTVSVKILTSTLKRSRTKVTAIVMDGIATMPVIISAEEVGCKVIAAKNFASTDTNIKLMSL